jgi:hypothetical protein
MTDFNELWAAMLKMAIKQARAITDDQEALTVQCLYKEWNKQLGKQLNVGEYIQHEGKLYRVLQAHQAQTNWVPGANTESLFVVIDKEHAGTLEDPIPYEGNMELFNGKYYSQNEVVYLCTRDSGVPLYHDLANLIGVYVQTI